MVISVNIQKGGCAKTTTVEAFGELLSKEHGKRVLTIDTDAQCSLSQVSNVDVMKCEHNIYTLLKEESTLTQSIVHTPYYDLIPGSPLLAKADTEFNKIGRDQFLKERIKNANYDVILIDTPPALSLMSIMALTACDKVLIPTEPSSLAMAGMDQLYETIDTVKKYLNPDISILGILIIKYNSRTTLTNLVIDAIQEYADDNDTKLFDSKVRSTVKIMEAQSQQRPICDWANDCTALNDYRNALDEIKNLL